MATVLDVASYILEQVGSCTAMKLQKLVYYAQAWSLVWDERPLFQERIEAWINGPVVPDLFRLHQGQFMLSSIPGGNSTVLTRTERETVDAVVRDYGKKSSQYLSDLTHMEAPWRETRQGMEENERGNREITHAALAEYYGSLPPGTEIV
ncbi:MAG: DUF4065 domain-containing protein [Magnetococcus sp. DMHC-1]